MTVNSRIDYILQPSSKRMQTAGNVSICVNLRLLRTVPMPSAFLSTLISQTHATWTPWATKAGCLPGVHGHGQEALHTIEQGTAAKLGCMEPSTDSKHGTSSKPPVSHPLIVQERADDGSTPAPTPSLRRDQKWQKGISLMWAHCRAMRSTRPWQHLACVAALCLLSEAKQGLPCRGQA